MVGELDAGNPHVQFDEGAQETCDIATRLCPTLPEPLASLVRIAQRSVVRMLDYDRLAHLLEELRIVIEVVGGYAGPMNGDREWYFWLVGKPKPAYVMLMNCRWRWPIFWSRIT